jgi:hypothetical protein
MFLKNWMKPSPTFVADDGSRFALKTDQRVRALMAFCGAWQITIRIQAARIRKWQESYRMGSPWNEK